MKPISTIVLVAALVAAIGCPSGSTTPPAPPAPKTVVVQVLDNSYDPKQVQINRGDTVRWVLAGLSPLHTVTALSAAFTSQPTGFPTPGSFFEHTFNVDNVTFNYSCAVHTCLPCLQGQTEPMRGSVRVGAGAPPPITGY